ncbi:Smr/MutS family protein [Maricaulis sp. D1M11]|uniref:Smr/MutS family protein n=1 Tax=Maricaulis sp. D1M11 TaxID=3076117 RepID=UPI0039B3E7B4
MTRKRDLDPEEKSLWNRIARSVNPLRKPRARLQNLNRDGAETAGEADIPKTKPAMTLKPPDPAVHRKPGVPVDRGSEKKMRRGQVEIDSRIDLHGMTQAQARPALEGFLRAAHGRGEKTVLVITGKGLTLDKDEDLAAFWEKREAPGVLKRRLPEWLRSPQMTGIVSGFAQAHLRHGGSGAFYVTLRRR